MNRSSLGWIVLLSPGAWCALEPRAEAFDYPEHAHISHDAIVLAANLDPRTEPLLRSAPAAIHSSNLCGQDHLFDDAPSGCFALSDIPALSGDHAASPLLVKWRWFNDCLAPDDADGFLSMLGRVVAGMERGGQSPEHVLLKAPRAAEMLALVRRFSPTHWPLPEPPGDFDFLGADDAYVTLGERGHPHFRPALSGPTLFLAQERANGPGSKPAEQSFAWYADLHAGAIEFARASAGSDFLGGVAVVLELTALHYLEDSVAAGHMVPARWMNNGSRMTTHNRYCREGVVAIPSGPLCAFAAATPVQAFLPALAEACGTCQGPLPGGVVCAAAPHAVRLLGDHQISNHSVATPSITRDWAVAVAAKSLLEVVAAINAADCESPVLQSCGAPVLANAPEFTWTSDRGACGDPGDAPPGPDQVLYRCLYSWWESRIGTNHPALVASDLSPLASTAFGMLPAPVVAGKAVLGDDTGSVTGAVLESRKGAWRTYPTDISFSGGSLAIDGLVAGWATSTAATLEPGANVGWRLVVPRVVFPVEVELGGSGIWGTSGGSALRSADAFLNARLLLGDAFFLSATGRVGVARRDALLYGARGGGSGGMGFILGSRTTWEGTLFLEAGDAGVTGPTVMTGGGVAVF